MRIRGNIMTGVGKFMAATIMVIASIGLASAFAEDYRHRASGIGGYDPVAYFIDSRAVRGTGYHVAVLDGVTYAFAGAEHQRCSRSTRRSICRLTAGTAPMGWASERNSLRTLRSGK